jgi:signal transduction histidine kinase
MRGGRQSEAFQGGNRAAPVSRLVLACLALLLASNGLSQTPFFYLWGPRDGLAQYSVSVITQDERGYIWLGTQAGASRFNGRTFENFNGSNGFINRVVQAILPLPDRVLLVSDAGRLYQVSGGEVTSLDGPPHLIAVLPEPGGGEPWLVTETGVVRSGGGSPIPFPVGAVPVADTRPHFAVVQDAVYFAVGTTVLSLKGGALTVLARLDGEVLGVLPDGSDSVEVVLAKGLVRIGLRNGVTATIWTAPPTLRLSCGAAGPGRRVLGTTSGELVVVREDGSSEIISRGLPKHVVFSVLVDREDNVWAGLDAGGLLLLPQTAFASFTAGDGVGTGDTFYIERDHVRGGVWVGTHNGGAAHIRGNVVRGLTEAEGLPSNRVRAILPTLGGKLYVGTANGIAVLDQSDKLKVIRPPCGGNFRALHETEEGEIFAGSQDGALVRLNGDDVECLDTSALPRPVFILAMFVYQGRLFVGTSRGVSVLERGRFLSASLTGDSEVRSFGIDKDQALWAVSRTNGAWRLLGGTWRNFREADGFDSEVRYVAISPDGTPWFAGEQGIWSYPDARGTRLSTRNGLSSNNIYILRFDPQGRLWVGTDRGLNLVVDGKVTGQFDYRDGLADNELNGNGFTVDDENRLWFCTMRGVSALRPDAVARQGAAPLLDLRKVEVNEEAAALRHEGASFAPLTLSHDRSSLRFYFSGQSFRNPERVTYSYQLEGFDDKWSRPATTEFAHYTKLPPGRYTFRVRAFSSDGLESEAQSLPVVIVPALWQSTVFKALLVLLAVGTGVGVMLWRDRRGRARNLELEQTVARRTMELAERRDQLEQINELVKSINARYAFDDLLGFLLRQTATIKGVDKASALIWDRGAEVFRFRAVLGWPQQLLAGVELTAAEARARYTEDAEEIYQDIFVIKRRGARCADEKFPPDPGWKAMLVFRIRVGDRVDGYLIFDTLTDENAFAEGDLLLLEALKEHIRSAFWKTRMLQDLQALNEKKNEFLGMAAHDLRSPLGLIQAWTTITMRQIAAGRFDPERGIRDLGRVVNVAGQMNRLVGELLDISAIESGKLKLNRREEDLRAILEECEQLHSRIASEKEISLTVEGAEPLPPVLADRERISEVVTNLLSNAIKFTHPGGAVRVYCEVRDGEVVTHVEDTGVGLTDDDLKAVFERFGKLSARPTAGESSFGLGLAIVKKIVEGHGGKVWVRSRRGVGSTFSFSLPRAA